jgi:arginine kinase
MPAVAPLRLFCVTLLMVALSGCILRSQPKAVAAPPPPKPAVAPPAPEPPLSIPQTSVRLPSPQEVPPEAIPPVPPDQPAPAEKAETTPSPRPPRHAPPAPKPDTTEQTAAPPAENTEPAAAPPQSAPFQPILTPAEQTKLKDAIETRGREIAERVNKAKARGLSSHDEDLVKRINSFLELSKQAAQRGDYTQADSLSDRALLLARELTIE